MLRVTFLTLLASTASANILTGGALRSFTRDVSQRKLQGDFDLDAFQFNFAGVNMNATVAQELCPAEWQAVVGCVIQTCPNFMDVCPELEVPAEYEGTARKLMSLLLLVLSLVVKSLYGLPHVIFFLTIFSNLSLIELQPLPPHLLKEAWLLPTPWLTLWLRET